MRQSRSAISPKQSVSLTDASMATAGADIDQSGKVVMPAISCCRTIVIFKQYAEDLSGSCSSMFLPFHDDVGNARNYFLVASSEISETVSANSDNRRSLVFFRHSV
jgi:hypothetical protein